MPYIFPTRVLTDGDVLDPLDLNDDIIPVTEIYSGGLDEHNLKAGTSAGLGSLSQDKILPGAFYSIQTTTKTLDPDMGSPPGPFSRPQLTNINKQDRVPNDSSWFPLPLSGSDTSITTTNESAAIWIEALLQYAIEPTTMLPPVYDLVYSTNFTAKYMSSSDDPNRGDIYGARIQFAIRLDGAVLPWTITGHEDPYYGAPRGEKPSVPYRISSIGELLANAPGPKIEQDSDLGQLGGYISPVRFGTVASVSAGSHTIEIVARRTNFTDATLELTVEDIISVYMTKVLLVEIPQIPRAGSTFDSIEMTPFDSESELSQAAFDSSIVAARTKLNAVKDGALSRGALRDVHLPTPFLDAATTFASGSGTQTTSNVFPGYTDTTSVNVNPGWRVFAQTSVTHTSTGTTSNQLVIFADAHVQQLLRSPASGDENDVMGAMAIVYSTNGGTSWTVLTESIVYFNNTQGSFIKNATPFLYDRALSRVNLNVPTMGVLPLGSPASGVTYTIGLAGCVIPTILSQAGSGTAAPISSFNYFMQVGRLNLSAFILRGS